MTATPGDVNEQESVSVSYPASIAALLGLVAALVVLEHYAEASPDERTGLLSVLSTLGLFAAFRLWAARGSLLETLCSLCFAVVQLLVLAIATALGTFIPQSATAEALEQRFGASGVVWIERLQADHIFRSYWFIGLLALFAASLAVLVMRRPFWKARYWGLALGHGGVVVLLAGGLLGFLYGEHGMIDLQKGHVTDRLTLDDGTAKSLGFGLRLDDFEVEMYPEQLRFVMVKLVREHKTEVTQTVVADQAGRWTRVKGTDCWFRAMHVYKAAVEERVMEAGTGSHPAAARIELQVENQRLEEWRAETDTDSFGWGPAQISFVWSDENKVDSAWLATTITSAQGRHTLSLPGTPHPVDVTLGQTVKVPGTELALKVVEFYPDFVIDEKVARTRSEQPRNPAIQYRVLQADGSESTPRYLFPNKAFSAHSKTDGLAYMYTPPAESRVFVRINGRARELVAAVNGQAVWNGKFELNAPAKIELSGQPVLAITVKEVLEHAVPAKRVREDAAGAAMAVVEHKTSANGPVEETVLSLDNRDNSYLRLPDDHFVVFENRSGEAKVYRSKVSVMKGDQVMQQATIAVNAPMSYGNYVFYQSKWDRNNLNITGRTVVKDPGFGLASVGMVLTCLGVLFVFYIRPRLDAAAAKDKE